MAALDPMARLEVIAEVGPEEEGTQIEEEWRAYCGAAADENSSEEEEEEETKKDDDEKACDDEIEGKIAAQLRASVRRHTELVEQSRTVQQREGAETEGRKSDAQTTGDQTAM